MFMPLERIVPGSPVAVLFIHGIMGTPEHFDFLLPLLPQDWSYRALRLEGHDGSLKDFNRASMARWREQTHQALDALASHACILVVTHSMGGLLVLDAAARRRVNGIFALALPLKILPKPAAGINALKVALGRVRPEDAFASAAKRCCGVEPDRRLWRYLGTIPRYLELFRLISRARRQLPAPDVPLEVWFSARDELVSRRSAKLLTGRKDTAVHFLPHAGHYHYPDDDLALLCRAFRDFCDRNA